MAEQLRHQNEPVNAGRLTRTDVGDSIAAQAHLPAKREEEFSVCVQVMTDQDRDRVREWVATKLLLGADPPSATVIGVHIDGRTWMP